jgi:hypothetical protein
MDWQVRVFGSASGKFAAWCATQKIRLTSSTADALNRTSEITTSFSSKPSRYRSENCAAHTGGIGDIAGRRAEQRDHELLMLRKSRSKAQFNDSF